jgi:hypothetical protein
MEGNKLEQVIRESLEQDKERDYQDLIRMLASGEAKMFTNDHGCWIVQIVQTKKVKTCHVWVVAGELPGVLDIESQVDAYAREHKCTVMTSVCRYGYGRKIAKERNWKITGLSVEKPILPD